MGQHCLLLILTLAWCLRVSAGPTGLDDFLTGQEVGQETKASTLLDAIERFSCLEDHDIFDTEGEGRRQLDMDLETIKEALNHKEVHAEFFGEEIITHIQNLYRHAPEQGRHRLIWLLGMLPALMANNYELRPTGLFREHNLGRQNIKAMVKMLLSIIENRGEFGLLKAEEIPARHFGLQIKAIMSLANMAAVMGAEGMAESLPELGNAVALAQSMRDRAQGADQEKKDYVARLLEATHLLASPHTSILFFMAQRVFGVGSRISLEAHVYLQEAMVLYASISNKSEVKNWAIRHARETAEIRQNLNRLSYAEFEQGLALLKPFLAEVGSLELSAADATMMGRAQQVLQKEEAAMLKKGKELAEGLRVLYDAVKLLSLAEVIHLRQMNDNHLRHVIGDRPPRPSAEEITRMQNGQDIPRGQGDATGLFSYFDTARAAFMDDRMDKYVHLAYILDSFQSGETPWRLLQGALNTLRLEAPRSLGQVVQDKINLVENKRLPSIEVRASMLVDGKVTWERPLPTMPTYTVETLRQFESFQQTMEFRTLRPYGRRTTRRLGH